ncbi:aromatic amino acid lyase [Rhodospirillaceae bacterium KN72]|uniref:Aromatic amino acid lyase n=1 Tax=Pacificispira spongiicola TaxID=2729598 RepID=A0A7Y0DXP0_9PROT|nr:aromatic amino acid lyase [Pacificispira spongiicola]NMM43513.1 aromatic amino acid lyase [Pacificispira spongiicola]
MNNPTAASISPRYVSPAPAAIPRAGKPGAPVALSGNNFTLDQIATIAVDGTDATIDESAWPRISEGRAVVEAIVAEGRPAYGITTGVGSQKESSVQQTDLATFNRRLLAAHATRVPGPTLDPAVVRAAMAVQLNLFATGTSGVRRELVERLMKRLNENRVPTVDASGSVGASDLVPLAQLGLGLLEDAPDSVFEPGAKEALSLMNSNAISLGMGSLCLVSARRLLATLDLAAAVALEGLRGNLGSIAEPVNRVHGRRGQHASSSRLRSLLRDSALWYGGESRFLQDPLSFRCVSQIHGVGHEVLARAEQVWEVELNAPTDNPLIDRENGAVISHGNMDSTALTAAIDPLRQILAKICELSGERLHKQHWPAFSGLPTGLAREAGAIGGVQFLNLSHIAASLIASSKIWATPVLLNSVGQLADGVEDTAGLAMHAVADLARVIEAAYKIATIELTVGVWAIHRRDIDPGKLGHGVRPVFEALLPLLPIDREGEETFSLSPLIDFVVNGDLVETAYDAAGIDPRTWKAI